MTPSMEPVPRWQYRLAKEQVFIKDFEGLSASEWRTTMRGKKVTSSNFDTVAAIDWPHYCVKATPACGGVNGFCYTFQGTKPPLRTTGTRRGRMSWHGGCLSCSRSLLRLRSSNWS